MSQEQRTRRGIIIALNVVMAIAGAAAAATLVMEYGFREPPVEPDLLHAIQTAIVLVFVLDWLVRLLIAPRRLRYLRQAWIDLSLILAAGAGALLSLYMEWDTADILSAGALYVFVAQGYLLVTIVLRAVTVNTPPVECRLHPSWLLIGGFLFLCLVGSGLLKLPVATREQYTDRFYYVDALFTAVSATCLAGLTVRDIAEVFTPFGQAVILMLIQLGGLGIVLFGAAVATFLGKGLRLPGTAALDPMPSEDLAGQLSRMVTFVVISTIVIEVIGAVLLLPMFLDVQDQLGAGGSAGKATWDSVFHSVSAFCNAGFSLYSDNMMHGARQGWDRPIRDHWQVIGVMAPLIVLGGIGFPVLQDCRVYLWSLVARLRGQDRTAPPGEEATRRPRLTLHTKIVLASTFLLICGGAAGLLIVESVSSQSPESGANIQAISPKQGDWRTMEPEGRFREAIFQSVSARTAGFSTIDCAELSNAGKLWMSGLMVVGGSPAGTAGGMKTVTFVLLLVTVWCVLRRRGEVEVFRRSIPADLVRGIVTLAVMYLVLVGLVTLTLCMVMPGYAFIDLLFESCSACGAVGLSTGITRQLTDPGKVGLILGMFIGRVGPLALVMALAGGLPRTQYPYPNEGVVIG
jgi:trk system potassium uptake protein TrkH